MSHRRTFLMALMLLLLVSFRPAFACTAQGCVYPGPRLPSVSDNETIIINALFGHLAGVSLSVSRTNWGNLATGEVNVSVMLTALQTTLGQPSLSATLSASASLNQILSAAASAAGTAGNTPLQTSLSAVATAFAGASGTIRLGDMLTITTWSGNSTINALNLVSGIVTLHNFTITSSTSVPAYMAVNLASLLNIAGVSNASISAKVIAPPRYICSTSGAVFKSASLRVKMNLTLVAVLGDVSTLNILLDPSVTIGHMDLWLEVAAVNNTIGTIDALNNALSAQATPGVTDLYLGLFADSIFFNRGRALNAATDLTPSPVGQLGFRIAIISYNVPIYAQSQAHVSAGIGSNLSFSAPYPRTLVATNSSASSASLGSTLFANMTLTLGPNLLGALLDPVLVLLKPILTLIFTPLYNLFMTTAIDPAMNLMGIKPGELVATSSAPYALCTLSGWGYSDANHNAHQELSEGGTGLTLYAKLIATATPTAASQAIAINTSTGAYAFTNILAAGYTVIVDNNNTLSDVTSFLPSGWLGTEGPTQSRTYTLGMQDVLDASFGFFNGSSVSGTVFRDTGIGGGTANNGVRDGTESLLPAVTLNITNNAGNTTYDTTATNSAGVYTLYIPATAGAAAVKVVETNGPSMVSVAGTVGTTGGTYDRPTDTLTFTNVVGSTFTGANFADVPANDFQTDGQQTVAPGNAVFYPHAFVAGTAGTITFSGAGTVPTGWTYSFYRDTNCNNVIDSGEPAITASVAAVAGDKVCVVVRVFVPQTAANSEQLSLTLTATFAYANNPLTTPHTRNDLTIAGTAGDGLRLSKSVDRATARTGDVITYTITYTNVGPRQLSTLKIYDRTPSYTTFSAAACGALASGLTGCSLAVSPPNGSTGPVQWDFTGQLAPGGSGVVTLQVVLQ